MNLPLAEQPVVQRHPGRKNAKAEKRSKPPAQANSPPKKTLLLSEISENLTSQFGHSKHGDNASSASFSSDSSRTLHYNFLGDESQPYKRSMDTSHPSHPALFPSDQSAPRSPSQARRKNHATVLTLEDIAAVGAIEKLVTQYGRVSHMGVLDPNYNLFVNKTRTAALSFKVHNKVALVMGDPLCKPDLFTEVLKEFKEYRKKFRWGVAFIGASEVFAAYAKQHKWTTLQFGTERVLNPMTNDVLNERSGKRIIVQCKQLLNPHKGNISLGVYVPSSGEDLDLQKELAGVYDSWREERNHAVGAKAFITVYDPFSMPGMMTYVYTRGPDGVANGFAALRRLGPNNGYHIDPCVAAPGAPRGITDLLIFAAMALLHPMGVSYLSLGFEPLESLADITRMPLPIEQITRAIYKRTFKQMLFKGKQAHHDKFKPDGSQGSPLYTLFPTGAPSFRQWVAVSHMSNISIRRLFFPRTGRKSRTTKQETACDQNKKPQ